MSPLKQRVKIVLFFCGASILLELFHMSTFRLCSKAHREQMGKSFNLLVSQVSDLYNWVDNIHIRYTKRVS